MENKPKTNNNDQKKELTATHHPTVGGDSITIHGDVGVGANIGRGTVQADQFAGRDLINLGTNGPSVSEDHERFARKMDELRDLIAQARDTGEIDNTMADEALESLEEVADLVSNAEKPAKNPLISKLSYVGDILDTAADLIDRGGVIARAVPIAALLIKIATRIF